jgi:purine-binding chemotaxis protein CheW
MPDGRSVVSVLTVDSLFGADAGRVEAAAARIPNAAAIAENTYRFVIFRVDNEDYGYPIEAIGEIIRRPEAMVRVPGAPDYIAGAVNLHGRVVPILDQRQRFGSPGTGAGGDDRVLVVDIAGARAGLLVDAVTDIREVGAGRIGVAPELPDGVQRLFDRVITPQQDEHMILVVDPDKLLSSAELDLLADISGAAETARL